MSSRIPPRFREARLDDLDVDLFHEVFVFAKAPLSSMGLLLSGPPGVGKTWAIAALTNQYLKVRGIGRGDYEFVTAPDFFANLDEFNDEAWDNYRDQSWEYTYERVPWLILNDLGKEDRRGKNGEGVALKLGRVLRARSEKELVTHITTNLTGKAMRETYGDSITSLLSEMVKVIEVNGPDRRRR